MKKELDRSKASFKLDLLETANADPMISPYDFRLLSAYVALMEWPSCRTRLSPSLAMSKTGIGERQFWISRACLAGKNPESRAYLIPGKRLPNGSQTYHLINPWRDEAMAHVEAMTAYHREVARYKKAKKREQAPLQNMQGHLMGCSCIICSAVPARCADDYPSMITPRKKGVREEGDQSPNVVLLKDHVKRSAG